jgi:hypothetical protein
MSMNRYLAYLALASICFLGGCKDSTGPATIPSTNGTSPASADAINEMSQEISTQKDFESSPFCNAYHCAFDKSWPLKTGETNLSYNISRKDLSVEIQTRNAQVTGLGLDFVDQNGLTEADYELIALLLKSTDAKRDHAATLTFIRKKILVSVCETCNVQEDAAHIQDGSFRVSAGTSLTPVLSLVRVDSATDQPRQWSQPSQSELRTILGDYSAAVHPSPNADLKLRSCDRSAANKMLKYGLQTAVIQGRGDEVSYRFSSKAWPSIHPVADALIPAFADADACIHQSARRIIFYEPHGIQVGIADPQLGLKIEKSGVAEN